jgi:hypothetical protein
MDQNERQFVTKVGLVAILLYALACLLPCTDGTGHGQGSDPGFPGLDDGWNFGILVLLFGWGFGKNGVPWSANPVWALGLWCLWKRRLWFALVLGSVATVLGLTTPRVRSDDAMMVGYFVWQTSLLLIPIGAAIALGRRKLEAAQKDLPHAVDRDEKSAAA